MPRWHWRQFALKRALGFANWLRSRHRIHDRAVLDALVADLRHHNPDHVAMTGDLGHIGLPQEFDAAVAFMEALGDRDRVSFVPGNHDAYVADSLPACLKAMAPWIRSDDGAPGFPWFRRLGNIALIGLSSAVQTGPLLATGCVGAAQLDRAEALLHYAKGLDLIRVVLIHHDPMPGAKHLRRLVDAEAFGRMLASAGADLVLHGHNHATVVAHLHGPGGDAIPVVGVASASMRPSHGHEAAAYHLVHIDDGASRAITITRRVIGEDGAMHEGGALDLS